MKDLNLLGWEYLNILSMLIHSVRICTALYSVLSGENQGFRNDIIVLGIGRRISSTGY